MQRYNPAPTSVSDTMKREQIAADICVIGAGAAGLSVAAGAVAFGRSVVLIEKGQMGGDCLNVGCVPSKALIAAARRAHDIRTAAPFGITAGLPVVDMKKVRDHIGDVIAAIAPNDSAARFSGLGVKVINAAARFTDRRTVVAGEYQIKARRFVIATGSSPRVPDIPGLKSIPYFTNETIFENAAPIEHLAILGGGPIGVELAQAYRRLGSRVTVIEAAELLAKEDRELASKALDALRAEGVDIREHATVTATAGTARNLTLTLTEPHGTSELRASHLLIAIGRNPNIADLDLPAARIKTGERGILVNAGLVTSNGRVFAIGDCIGSVILTNAANDQAGVVLKRALFRYPARFDAARIPRVTFTDPELASVGMSEAEAIATCGAGKVRVLRWPFHDNDRAQAERRTTGLVKVLTNQRGRILGAAIVGPEAGELIQVWALALARKLSIQALADWVPPYPTLGEVNKRAAFRYYATAPANPLIRKLIDLLAKLG